LSTKKPTVKDLLKRIEDLENRVAELEKRPWFPPAKKGWPNDDGPPYPNPAPSPSPYPYPRPYPNPWFPDKPYYHGVPMLGGGY
jgi:hypothetical protein